MEGMTPVTSLGPLVEIEKELRGYLSGGDDSWLHPYKEGRSAYLSVVEGMTPNTSLKEVGNLSWRG